MKLLSPRFFYTLKKDLFTFRQGNGGRKRRETSVCASCASTGDLAHNPDMCPDWESANNPLVRRPALSPLNHTDQCSPCLFDYCVLSFWYKVEFLIEKSKFLNELFLKQFHLYFDFWQNSESNIINKDCQNLSCKLN